MQLVEGRSIDSAVFFEAVMCPRPKLFEVPAGLGHTDDGYVEVAALHHSLQRREDFLVGQIARGTKEDQGVAMEIIHGNILFLHHYLPTGFSSCPPKPKRIAESNLS